MTDLRKPALVTAEFRQRVAAQLAPLGFVMRAQAKALVRKVGKNVHRVEFLSSHSNAPGHAVVWPALVFEDAGTRELVKGWRAGGTLDGPAFALDAPSNVANPEEAESLAAILLRSIAFFDWLEEPLAVLRDVSSRYVPGLVDPVAIVPYLRTRLGDDAVNLYAGALLRGRPELAPAFATERDDAGDEALNVHDHGTQLARALRAHVPSVRPELPCDVVRSTAPSARALRSSIGLQLRAWGEPEAAHMLRHVDDDDIQRAHRAQNALDEPFVDSVAATRIALTVATGVDRAPRRRVPEPRLFQYYARHDEFGRVPGRQS